MAGHHHTATVAWRRGEGDFAKGRYSRAHSWRFDGGLEVPASASPSVVPLPHSSAEAVDPEVGTLAKHERGARWVSEVVLRPRITFGGRHPTAEELDHLHHEAHDQCFIANSVKSDVRVEAPATP